MTEETQTNKDKIQNIFIIATTITMLIFLLTVFFGVKYYRQPHAEKLTYNSFNFIKQTGTWYTTWQRKDKVYEVGLRYNPQEVEDVPIRGTLNNSFNKKNKIYITFDPFSNNKTFKYLALAASELSTNLAGALSREPVAACTQGEQLPACAERPIVNCDNRDLNIIYLKSEEPTQVVINNTCITMQGKDLDIMKSVEKSLYLWYGIIKQPPSTQQN